MTDSHLKRNYMAGEFQRFARLRPASFRRLHGDGDFWYNCRIFSNGVMGAEVEGDKSHGKDFDRHLHVFGITE